MKQHFVHMYVVHDLENRIISLPFDSFHLKENVWEARVKSFIFVKNLPYLFVFWYDVYGKDLNSLVYKDE